ncbi:MAG: FHA domain-containing protein [Clostridiales bacterium]|nr:FHA domain-containing protein [Clostridiales bacterium]
MGNMLGLIMAALLLVILTGILISLLLTDRRERIDDTNRKIILRGGKNMDPYAAADGDGIIGEDMSRDPTIVQTVQQKQSVQMLCLTELKSRCMYRGQFHNRQLFIGRRPQLTGPEQAGQLCVEAPGVSQVHCRIYETRDGYAVEDCRSTNHTWVNGKKVAGSVRLKSGDLLRIADRVYQVQFTLEHTT